MREKIVNKTFGILTYGITPPKATNSDEKIEQIANRQMERIRQLDIDALIIYDIQDESDRTEEERTFEFIKTVDPSVYANHYLKELDVPKIVYRCVGNYPKDAFATWMDSGVDDYTVFVGTASSDQDVHMSLTEAYNLRETLENPPLLGGVTIPERHLECRNEPERMAAKISQGVSFFVSQCVYDPSISKGFLRDYKRYFTDRELPICPIIFTLTPCGSEKTLNFIKWLGIRVPQWVEEDLLKAPDMLAQSLNLIEAFFGELLAYALELGIPVGCNVESVSIRKTEIEASIKLAKDIRRYIQRQSENF